MLQAKKKKLGLAASSCDLNLQLYVRTKFKRLNNKFKGIMVSRLLRLEERVRDAPQIIHG